MKKRLLYTFGILVVVAAVIFLTTNFKPEGKKELAIPVEQGQFEVLVTTSGEMEAKNSTPILGPQSLTAARIWSVKIEDIVEEGTIVKKGEYVATLDRTEIGEEIRNEEVDVEESLNNYERAKIDSALELRGFRDELKKKLLIVEKKELELRNSQYEPPATIQQAELDLKQAKMDYQLAKEAYELRQEKAISRVRHEELNLIDDQADLRLLVRLYDQFVINAPDNGMVIYHKERGGKIRKGSSISARDPVVATLPDMSKMISRCYVNEVDIRLIERGQRVRIGIDAFPEKSLSGTVTRIANVGESLPSTNAKVFEVQVEIEENDPELKPGMTTSNQIVVKQIDDALYLPLESLHNTGDSMSFVYLQKGLSVVKQQVETGTSNANFIVITSGLEPASQVLLTVPDNADDLKMVALN
jgi:multidrug efflux pump subunit AcrA (membrane-fusion protein)